MDHAHHANNAVRALDEVLALEEAVLAALQLTSREETLLVVTADHSHVFTLGGAPPRGNPIFGEARRQRPARGGVCVRHGFTG